MTSVPPLSSFDYRWATRPIGTEVAVPFTPALPALVEPAAMPAVTAPVDEPLELIAHRRIRTLDVYWHAGWQHARPGAWVRSSVAATLAIAVERLPARFGLAVFDAWRPLELQEEIYRSAYADPTLPDGFVSVPSTDPERPPPHLTGGTVDVTLTFDHIPLELGTCFDDFSDQAHTAAFEATPGKVRAARRLLHHVMSRAGFVVLDCEWWHFEFGTPRWAAITGQAPLFGPAAPPQAS
jgi:D-alanyl-D-alanine dipeptidase